jgi:hypothetical protein
MNFYGWLYGFLGLAWLGRNGGILACNRVMEFKYNLCCERWMAFGLV